MTQGKIGAAIFIVSILGFWLSAGSYAQEGCCKIIELVTLKGGKTEKIPKSDKVKIRDSLGRDRTPKDGVDEDLEVLSGRFIECGESINAALQIDNDKIFWMNSETSVQFKEYGIKIIKGEIYSKSTGLRLELADGNIIDSTDKNKLYPDGHSDKSKAWKGTIKSLTTPLWQKPKFYIPTAAVIAGVSIAAYYFTREQAARVSIHITVPQ